MSLFLTGVKFARPICHNRTFHSRPLLAVRFFSQTGFKSNEETAHLERRRRQKSGIPKKEKGPTWWESTRKQWWESTRKQLGEEWQKAFAGAVFIGIGLFFAQRGSSYSKSIDQALVEGTFVSNSLNLLRDNEKALFLLGFPICNLPIDYRDEENTFTNEDEGEAKILVPVSGPSGEGKFHLYAARDEDGYWQAKRCELELEKCSALEESKWKGKKLVVYDRERHTGQILSVNTSR